MDISASGIKNFASIKPPSPALLIPRIRKSGNKSKRSSKFISSLFLIMVIWHSKCNQAVCVYFHAFLLNDSMLVLSKPKSLSVSNLLFSLTAAKKCQPRKAVPVDGQCRHQWRHRSLWMRETLPLII